MKLIDSAIKLKDLEEMAKKKFGNLVKAVVDIKREVVVLDADLHADEEAYLLAHGSKQSDLWGINLYPGLTGKDFVEFDSMINVRPNSKNLTRGIEDIKTREKIYKIVRKLIE